MSPVVTIDPGADEPPFEQVRRQVAEAVGAGTLAPGTPLPTVRALAAELGLAVNTVAKAYRALEADGVVVTEGRRGTSVASREPGEAAAIAFVRTVRADGVDLDTARRLVERHWT